MQPPVLRPLGDTALSVEFGDRIDPALIARVHAFDRAFAALALPGVIETVPTYRATTLHLDPLVADLGEIEEAIYRTAAAPPTEGTVGALWEVPVLYGGVAGEDLPEVAARAGLSVDEAVSLHAGAEYRVAMVGFLPGFSYLSGLDPRLATPRRADPRPGIPSSSISIGGEQTAIGSLEGPSGWHLVGRTPVRPYQPGREPVFLFAPGDRIRFCPIAPGDWDGLEAKAERGAPVARRLAE